MARCVDYLRTHNYSERCISNYQQLWKNGIRKFLQMYDSEFYTPEIGQEYARSCIHDGRMTAQDQKKVRSITVLTEMLLQGTITRGNAKKTLHEITGEWSLPISIVLDEQRKLRRSERTLLRYSECLEAFSMYLSDHDIHIPAQITESDALVFISGHSGRCDGSLTVIRTALRIWTEKGFMSDDFRESLYSVRTETHSKLPSAYSKDDVLKVETTVDRNSAVGKRNYAILLLASRLGLRASDIASLKLGDIDWENNAIRLRMKKTDKEIELPLLSIVGDAIVDYLKNGRPASNSSNVFLSCRAPFEPLENGSAGCSVSRIIVSSGINTEGKHHGPHSLRHSLATTMLSNGATMPVISEALGHRSTEATMAYIRIDMSSMSKCVLPVPSIDESFFSQKGGAFYE